MPYKKPFCTFCLIWSLPLFMEGCLDYIKIDPEGMNILDENFPPLIDKRYISPSPDRSLQPINVGKNCKGQIFHIPPIKDRNKNDRLYYLWFFDNKLVLQAIIEPDHRSSAVISLLIDYNFLLNYFGMNIKEDFFSKLHHIEMFVSDKQYKIPASHFIDNGGNELEHENSVYWIVSFSKDDC